MAKPKTQTVTTKITNFFSKPMNVVGFVGATIVVIGLAYLLVVRPLQIRAEKQQFLAAQQELRKIADEIQEQVGPADSVSEEQSCSRPNLKFSDGDWLCSVSVKITYPQKNLSESNTLVKDLSKFYVGNVHGISMSNLAESTFNDTASDQVLRQYLETELSKPCIVTYERKVSKQDLTLRLSCSKQTLEQYYAQSQ